MLAYFQLWFPMVPVISNASILRIGVPRRERISPSTGYWPESTTSGAWLKTRERSNSYAVKQSLLCTLFAYYPCSKGAASISSFFYPLGGGLLPFEVKALAS